MHEPTSGLKTNTMSDQQQWLTLKDASEFLGVHFTTLRGWADSGEIRVFRTPGGHRRFSLADLRRFLEERASQALVKSETALVEAAVGLARRELESLPQDPGNWNYPLRDEAANDSRRHRGRQLFTLAIAFVMKPNQRPRLLEEGRKLGYEYGREARQSNVGLAATGRAVRFFRSQLIEAVRSEEQSGGMDADDVRIQWLIDQFLDEVLYAVLDGYEQRVEDVEIQLPPNAESFKRS
jgi:excisionase family DNA binding protein